MPFGRGDDVDAYWGASIQDLAYRSIPPFSRSANARYDACAPGTYMAIRPSSLICSSLSTLTSECQSLSI